MFEKIITSFQDYIDTVLEHDDKTLGYRGVSNKEHKLIPAIGRVCKEDQMRALMSEQNMFLDFKKELVRFKRVTTDIECAILAQHYGLPTRLLDWTYNPLVALYFAINSKTKFDACIYLLSFNIDGTTERDVDYTSLFTDISIIIDTDENNISTTTYKEENPKHYDISSRYYTLHPSSTTDRIVAQKSFFTLHHDPFSALEDEIHGKLIIPHDLKQDMDDALDLFGVTAYTLFPDIGGLTTSLKQAYFSSISE